MLPEWIAVEHYRLHIVEDWPDSPSRVATLAGIRSSLASLSRDPRVASSLSECTVCRSRKMTSVVLEFRNTSSIAGRQTNLAA